MMFGTSILLPCAAEKSRAFAQKTTGLSILRADENGTISDRTSAPRAGVRKPKRSGATVFGFSISPGRAIAGRAGNRRPETPGAQRLSPAERRESARNRNVNRHHDSVAFAGRLLVPFTLHGDAACWHGRPATMLTGNTRRDGQQYAKLWLGQGSPVPSVHIRAHAEGSRTFRRR